MLASVALGVAFRRSLAPIDGVSWGDGALLEMYTLHASRGAWALGPYSQFAVYLLRANDLAISYWNPHIVVVPAGALMLLAAAVAAGRATALPALTLTGSFLAQTPVSLVPVVVALVTVSVASLLIQARRAADQIGTATRRGMGISTCLLAVVWGLPVGAELIGRSDNLSKQSVFSASSDQGQPWLTAGKVWSQMVMALFAPGLRTPVGAALPVDGTSLSLLVPAVQLVLLAAAGRAAARRGDRFHASLCVMGIVASVAALSSITRIHVSIADYMVFWMSMVGTLSWAAVAGAVSAWIPFLTLM